MKNLRTPWMAVACSLASILCAQDSAPAASEWKLGMSVSPGIAYRSLMATAGDGSWDNYVTSRNDYEEPRFVYGGSLYCALGLSDRFSVEGGLGYALMGYQLNMGQLTYGDMIDPNRGFIYETNDAPRAIRYSFHYAELPLRLVFHYGKGRLRWISAAGLTTSYLLKSTSTMVTVDTGGSTDRSTSESSYDYNTIGLFPTLSTGVSYALNDRMELRLEPQARYGVLRIIDAPITTHLWSAGVGFSAMWRL